MTTALATQPADDLTVTVVGDRVAIQAQRRGRTTILAGHDAYALTMWMEFLSEHPVEFSTADLPAEAAAQVTSLYQDHWVRGEPTVALPASIGVSTVVTVDGDYSVVVWLSGPNGYEPVECSIERARALAQRILDCALIVALHS